MAQLTIFERDTYPAEQFDDVEQQSYTATIGMWAFLATEVLFIGAIFVSFYVYRLRWPDAFAEGARELKWYLGAINTAVLLGSSFTMALAVHEARSGGRRRVLHRLLATIGLGALFLLIKFTEYVIEYHDRLVPTLNYSAADAAGHPRPLQLELFMSFYFVLTGVHALHMIVGLSVLLTLAIATRSRNLSLASRHRIEIAGLYWHFVDLVWVFVFPTLYLLRQR